MHEERHEPALTFTASTDSASPPELDLEFDEDVTEEPVLGLAVATRQPQVEAEIWRLLGSLICSDCQSRIPFTSALDSGGSGVAGARIVTRCA